MMDHGTVEIQWEGESPNTEIIAEVRADIAHNLAEMEHPSRLIYHHVQLTPNDRGPAVVLWGARGKSCFFARYQETTKWVDEDDIEDMIANGKGDPT